MAEQKLDFVVVARFPASDSVVVLDLASADGAPLPAWTPGSHIDLEVGDGLIRQYSLCGDPGDTSTYRIGVLLEESSRGGSAYVHDKMWPGSTVAGRGPRNRFTLEEAPSYVFVAGGVGITPILPMLGAATRSGASWHLHYGGRSVSTMAFAADLRAEHNSKVSLLPQDVHGLLDLGAILATVGPETLVYCCGPAPLLDAVEEACAVAAPGRLRVERFTAPPTDGAAASQVFEVEIASTGQIVEVGADLSTLEALEDAGVIVDWSCREGVCGTCQVAVLSGAVDHRDAVLDEEEREAGKLMQVCVSRASGTRLVLDL